MDEEDRRWFFERVEKKAGTVYDRQVWGGFFFALFKRMYPGSLGYADVYSAKRDIFSYTSAPFLQLFPDIFQEYTCPIQGK